MPEPPGWVNEFNFVKFFVLNTCHRPWTLYVESLFPPTVGAARTLLMLDVPQILRTLFRPKKRTERHGRKNDKKRGPHAPKVPDPNESVAGEVKKALGLGERKIAAGARELWNILDKGEGVLGKIFIFDLVEDWLYKYALFVDAGAAVDCGVPAVRGEGTSGYTAKGITDFVTGVHEIWAVGGASLEFGIPYMPIPDWLATCGGTLTNLGGNFGHNDPVTVEVGIINDDGTFVKGSTSTHTCSLNSPVDFMCTSFFRQSEAVSCRWGAKWVSGDEIAGVWMTNVVIFCQGFR